MKNKKIILLCGIPASGKSTWANKFILNNSNYVRINRDMYRLMLDGSQIMDFKGEKLVTELVNNAIVLATKSKYNVLVDQTNVNLKYLNEMVAFCEKIADVEFKIFDITEKVAIERDSNRDAKVGAKVIKKMYKNYLNLFSSNFDFSTRKRKPHIATNIKWERDGTLPDAVIFDIDSTIAHTQGKRGIFDWDKVNLDIVDEIVLETIKSYKDYGYKIIFVTGRDGVSRKMTEDWLIHNKIPFDMLFTKPKNDFRKDIINKTEIYHNFIKPNYNVLAVYDDRNSVCKMWRNLGVKCYQVQEGDF